MTASPAIARRHRGVLLCLLLGLASALPAAAAETTAADGMPTAQDALAAWRAFAADPPARLDRTGPFLDYIRNGGVVHIVLNDGLLGFMYDTALDEPRKAVLYAAYLGANMASQLEREETGSDNLAAMRGTLAAYRALQAEDATFAVSALEPFAQAEAAGALPAAVHAAVTGTGGE
ncbi:MAG: hypothetical protein RLW62_17260 [Gammaproteobacteria bacterium]